MQASHSNPGEADETVSRRLVFRADLCAAVSQCRPCPKQGTIPAEYRVGDRLATDKAGSQAYRQIEWDDLIPKGWDPMAAFKGLDLARLKDSDPKAQEALEKMRSAWDQAPVETALNGQRVRIAGFVVPLERKGEQILEFLLVPYFGACIHVPPPPANQIIHVVPKSPSPECAPWMQCGSVARSNSIVPKPAWAFLVTVCAAKLSPRTPGRRPERLALSASPEEACQATRQH
jgi:hypothetical protein